MKALVVGLVMGAASGLATADVLWGKAAAGATLADIKAAYPEGRDVEPSPDRTLKSGAVQRYRLDALEIGSERLDAHFYFLSDQLTQVMLKLEKPVGRDSCGASYTDLQTALRSKYGQEVGSTRSGGLSNHWRSTFVAGKTGIDMTMFAYDHACTIYVIYSNKVSSTADKL